MTEMLNQLKASRWLRFELWLRGLIAAFIGGGASAVSATVSACVIAPDAFNVGAQLGNFFKLAGSTFVVSGVLSVVAYLKQSPLPPIDQPFSATIITAPSNVITTGAVNPANQSKSQP